MRDSYVFYQGDIVKEDTVSIGIRSKAFNYGLGCFEGIRAYLNEENNELYVFRMKEHYERLLQSCKTLNIKIPYTVEELMDITVELLRKNNLKTTTYIRPVAYKAGESIATTLMDNDDRFLIYCNPMGGYTDKKELKAAVTSWMRVEDNMLPPRTKATAAYLNSGLASLEVLRKGYDEAIFLTRNGHVSEGTAENIFMVRKGQLVTPPPSDNILEGITRDTIMILAREELGLDVVERSITRTELYSAEELFFCGTAMGVAPIIEVDDRIIGNGNAGNVTEKLRKLYSDISQCKNPKYSKFCTRI
ncbi:MULTISPECIES: branched-chain amino acid transaminase [Clostridium]|uniref:Branched-chain-amino-acid aminotransferase n=1 Tax=Clostridium novyi (strain NT) TaxID=386415 RepID=A0Q235_CLONN|nr:MULTISPECIES: branched-chain amino acid transaminase [Clostridium]ABK62327.1 branched-chain amino acid aminotransferase [Clostridium novyi NT]KEH86206.1 branched-chain amino acid aminotransferase [Clostridium novyi A str. NCTC 538]KEH87123.1 branched-chain amino acid aminotransferase [Clostridium novyi A str. BKT29909]KEH88490.1 branched-chain amino acid aminotransferase [Clostridium novyi A str. 4540]KEH90829.1 branched-chain amino acid aminotransferase [Clostridium botulinum C/D str. It1]